jgi:hybrid cluster-associated redox disulfide protein
MKEVTKDTIVGDILDIAPEAAPLFLEIGMHCLGCPSARGESIEMACAVHGVDADELVEKINNLLSSK